MITFNLSPRRIWLARVLLVLTALLLLVGCADGQTNPLTDPGNQQSALDTVGQLRFWLWIVVAIAIALFVGSFVSQTWLPEWYQSHRMSVRVGALVVGLGAIAFNWAIGQAEASMGGGGVILLPLAQHALQLAQALPHLLR